MSAAWGRGLGKRARQLSWWALDYIYAVVWQARGVLSRARPADYRSGDQAPVIILPGIYESWHFMLPLVEALHSAGHPVHVITELRHNRRPVAQGADAVVRYIRQHALSDVVIVAHSKGGLIGKQVMVTEPAVQSMVAVCTPFSGSRYASFMFLPSLRAFRASDAGILALRAKEDVNSRIVSLYGRFDPHIPEGSELPGARNIRIDTGGHFRILADPATIAAVVRAADDEK
nr:alpha/beta hydrolase [Glaciihabitans tibetensis]